MRQQRSLSIEWHRRLHSVSQQVPWHLSFRSSHLPGDAAAGIIASAALNGFETSADVLLPWLPMNEASILRLRLLESLTLRSISAELEDSVLTVSLKGNSTLAAREDPMDCPWRQKRGRFHGGPIPIRAAVLNPPRPPHRARTHAAGPAHRR